MDFALLLILQSQLIVTPGNTLNLAGIDLSIPREPLAVLSGDIASTSTNSDRLFFMSQKNPGILSTTKTNLGNRSFTLSKLPRNIAVGSRSLFYIKDPLSSEFVFTNQARTEIFYASTASGSALVDLKSCGPFTEISDIHLTETAGALAYLIVTDKGSNKLYSYVLNPGGLDLCTTEQSLSLNSPSWIRSISGSPPTIYVGYKSGSSLAVRSYQASDLTAISAEVPLTSATRAQFGNPTIDQTNSELIMPIFNFDNKSDELEIFDSTLATETEVSSCRSPQNIAIDYEGASRLRYIFCPANKKIQIRNTSNTLLATLTTGEYPKQMLVGSDGTTRYISILQTNGQVVLHQFAVSSTTYIPTTTTLTLGGVGTSMGQYIGAGVVSDQLVVTVPEDNAISIIDLSAQSISSTLTFPKSIDSITPASSTVMYFSSTSSNAAYGLTEINSDAWTLDIYPTGNYPLQIGYRTNRLYTLNRDSNTVSVINLTTRAINSIATGTRPIHFDMDTTVDRLWAVNETSQSLSVLDITVGSEAIVGGTPIALGFTPKKVLYYSGNTTLFVLGNSTLRTINAPTLATVANHSLTNASTDMVLETSGVAVSSMNGNNLYLATRSTISSQSLTSAPHLLTSNGSVAVAGQKIETAVTTSTGLQQTIASFDRFFTASSMFLTFRKSDARLVGFPYSLLSASRFPQFETRLHIGADKVASDSLGNIWIADSSQLKIEKISRYFQITSLRNELTNHPETPAIWDTQDRLYIPLRNLNAVAIVNASTGEVDIEGVCQSPRKSVIDTSQTPAKLFTICPEGDLLSVITLDLNGDFSSQALVGVGKFPIAMELIPDTVNRLFIANKNSDSVSIINSTSNAVVSTLTVQDSPVDLALNTATNTIELAHEGSAVITHIASAGTTTSTTLGASGFSKISVNPTSSQIFALSRSRSSVASSPALTITSSGTNLIDGEMAYSIVSESTLSKTYITYPDADVVRIIAESGTQTDVAVGSRPVFVFPYATASKVFVSNYDDDTVSIIGLATNSVSATATLTSGCGPTESRVMSVGVSTYLYVLCQKNDSVEIINTSTNAVGTPISLRLSE